MDKNILFLTTILPFPGNSGGTIASKRNLDIFYENDYKICLVFFDNNSDKNDIKMFMEKYPKITIQNIFNNNNKRSIKNLIISLVKFIPLNIYRNNNKSLSKIIKQLLQKNDYYLIYCDHLEMFQYIPKSYHTKSILYEHNAEFMIWKRYARQLRNPILKIAVFVESLRYKHYELRVCEKAGITLAAPNDILILSRNSKHKNTYQETYHLGDDTLLLRPQLIKPKNEIHILFIGTMTWQANIDAVCWFEKKILPLLVKDYPQIIFDVVGKLKDDSLKKNNQNPNIIYHGFVESTEPFFQQSTAFVCPLQFGSGMKVKNIEALYRGIPLVTTTVGAESIDLHNGIDAFISDKPEIFASFITKLIQDDSLWDTVSKNARNLARSKYTKSQAEIKFLKQVESIVQ